MSSHSYIFNRAPHNTGHTWSPIVRLSSFLSNITVGRCLFPTASASGSSALSWIDGPTEVSVTMGEPSIWSLLRRKVNVGVCSLSARNVVAQHLFPTSSGSSAPTRFDGPFDGSVIGEHSVRVQEVSDKEDGERTSRCFPVSLTTAN